MRWNPSFLVGMAAKPDAQTSLPAIGSPVMGLDASMTDRIFTNVAGSIAAVNTNPVARIGDAFDSPTVRWEQSNTVARPMFVTGIQAGRPAIRFDGVNHFMWALGVANPGTLFQSRTFTMALVYRRPTNSYHIAFSAGNSTGGDGNAWLDNLTVNLRDTGHVVVDRPSGSQYGNVTLSSATFPPGQVVKLVVRCSPASGMEVLAKGALGLFVQSGPVPLSPDTWTWDAATIGCGLAASDDMSIPREPMNGDLFEFRFWAARADDTARNNLLSYLDNKWGS